jgi:hypothetical protein
VIDFAFIAAQALANAETILRELFPEGRRKTRQFCVGNLSGAKGDSLQVNLETGAWSDFATGEKGGADLISLWARARDCKNSEAANAIAEQLGLNLGNGNGKAAHHSTLTVAAYAEAKGFPLNFLAAYEVVQESRGVKFTYHDPDGTLAARHKLRLTLDKGGKRRFEYLPAEGKPLGLYGLACLAEARKQGGGLHITEGETDWLSMRFHGLPAVSLPSSSAFKTLAREHVAGFGQIYVHRDNDGGGESFVEGLIERLRAFGFDGEARIVRYPDHIKDPGELHLRHSGDPGGFEAALRELLEQAERVISPPRLDLRPASTIAPEDVRWLWDKRIPFGKVTLISGDPEKGKSMLAATMAAHLSRGRRWPDGAACGLGTALLLSAEDGPADTTRPRLDAARADCERVIVPPIRLAESTTYLALPDHVAVLERAIREIGATLVVIDPLAAFMSPKLNRNRDEDVRQALTPLCDMAERTSAAIVGIRHLNKGGGSNPAYRSGGSVGIIGAVRAAHLVALDPEDDKVHVFIPYKNNLEKLQGALPFRIIKSPEDKAAHIEWIAGESRTYSARDLLRGDATKDDGRGERDFTKLDLAKRFLVEMLRTGPRLVSEVEELAEQHGIAPTTLRRAREGLKVRARRNPAYQGPFKYHLPEGEFTEAA